MKPFLCLSLFAFLLASSCTQQEREPAANIPAPPPPGQISHNTSSAVLTSSTTAARVEVGGTAWEAGSIAYWDHSGCSGVRFQARSFGSPYVVQVSGSTCPGSRTDLNKTIYPTSSWQSYDFSIVQFQGGALTVMAQADGSGSYGGVELTNIVWY